MKTKGLRLVLCMVMLVLCFGTVSQARENPEKGMNVVFVMDASGSMLQTDTMGWRYEALDLFLGMSSDTGNYMGAIVFNDEIILQQEMAEMDGRNAKLEFAEQIRDSAIAGDTDIGAAVEQATQMLREGENPELPSAIIVLSDGNTDLPNDVTGEALQASEEKRLTAIENARQNDYPIYCIGLNANQQMDPTELQEMADATGGVFMEVTRAEDLKNVFNQFYSMIFGTERIVVADETIPESGVLEIPFEIPSVGVMDANIIIQSLNENTSYAIFRPDGTSFTESELDEMRITARTFAVIKIPEPESGMWNIRVEGIAGDDVKIDMVYNADYQVSLTASGESFAKGSEVEFTAQILEEEIPVENAEVYETYPARLTLTNMETGEQSVLEMEAEGGSYVCHYTVNDPGTWNVQAEVSVTGMHVRSEEVEISVENAAPEWTKNTLRVAPLVTFFSEEWLEKDLSELAFDPNGDSISFQVTESDFDSTQVYVEGAALYVKTGSCGKGDLQITAVDELGAESAISVRIAPLLLWKLLLGILAGIAVIGVIVLVCIKFVLGSRPFNGEIMVVAFDNEEGIFSVPKSFGPGKGKAPLYRYVTETGGIDARKSYFTATGKDYIWFQSPKGYYSTQNPETKSRKIRLDGDIEVVISRNKDLESGIRVTYMPFRY